MRLPTAVVDELRVAPGAKPRLSLRSTSGTAVDWLGPIGHRSAKEVAEQDLAAFRSELAAAQDRLWVAGSQAVLVILQALDAAGKDGTIKHVMAGVNPQGCEVTSFKQPSEEELSHDFLWRYTRALPARGRIGIFNRSYYEEVLVTRVHPELLEKEGVPTENADLGRLWRHRLEEIAGFEHHLVRNGTTIVKVFLHISREEQKRRLLERIDDPEKNWKLSVNDVTERSFFDQYQSAYEEAIAATSSKWAPWYVVPADHKYALRALVGGLVVDEIERLDLKAPRLDEAKRAELKTARELLLRE